MKKCYVTDVEVGTEELREVQEILDEGNNMEKVTDYYNLVHLMKEGDEYYDEEDCVVLSLKTVYKALGIIEEEW